MVDLRVLVRAGLPGTTIVVVVLMGKSSLLMDCKKGGN